MSNRAELARKAVQWNEYVRNKYPQEIFDCALNSKIYTSEFAFPKFGNGGKFYLRQIDSVSCAFDDSLAAGKTAILNYASYKNPGGFFLGGSSAQEEALCHESILFPVLGKFEPKYYANNRKDLNRALYRDVAIYSPDVIFEHNGEVRKFDVITCAAPNWGTAMKYCQVSRAENDKVMRDRIKFMYSIAMNEGVDTLIAGAWGCGVFKQDPAKVCYDLVEECPKGITVCFAIPDDKNYLAFEQTLEMYYDDWQST